MRSCEWGDRIESSTLRGTLGADEREHVRVCAECRKLVGVVRALMDQGRAAERRGARHVPSARMVLLRARQIRERKLQRRVLRPIVWVERIAGLTGIFAALTGVAWLARRSAELARPLAGTGFETSGPPDLTTTAMIVSGLVLVAAILFGLSSLRPSSLR